MSIVWCILMIDISSKYFKRWKKYSNIVNDGHRTVEDTYAHHTPNASTKIKWLLCARCSMITATHCELGMAHSYKCSSRTATHNFIFTWLLSQRQINTRDCQRTYDCVVFFVCDHRMAGKTCYSMWIVLHVLLMHIAHTVHTKRIE